MDELAAAGYEIIYYNTKQFEPAGEHAFHFRAYPDDFTGYYSDSINNNISYFQYGELLIDAAASVMDFFCRLLTIEKPSCIIHSHMAVWGKLLAEKLGLPHITLFNTFVLDKNIMIPFFRQLNTGKEVPLNNIADAMGLYRKIKALYHRLQLQHPPDLWEVYTNKGDLNISFILPAFQPQLPLMENEVHFVGLPRTATTGFEQRDTIYFSMGTNFNRDPGLYEMFVEVCTLFDYHCVIATGIHHQPVLSKPVPEHISLVPFVNQQEVIARSLLFVTRGGMASVHEAIYMRTPMVVIPLIPEQQLTAATVAGLGIGIHLQATGLSVEVLYGAIREILLNQAYYTNNIASLSLPVQPPQQIARDLITNFLTRAAIELPAASDRAAKTVVELFIEQAVRYPSKTALQCGEDFLTYQQLQEKSNRLAHYLAACGVHTGTAVPVILRPSINSMVAMMGILKAGAVYVPVDPEFPDDRVAFLLEQTACPVVITHSALRGKTGQPATPVTLLMDLDWPVIEKFSSHLPDILPKQDDLCYIMYTSGSTGQPKGVMVEHQQIATYTHAIYERLSLHNCDSYAILGTFAADAGLTAVFAALCYGSCLHIIDVKNYARISDLASQFERCPVDCFKITPSLMAFFLQQGVAASILPRKCLILGGEASSKELVMELYPLLPPACRLFNHYGPTETTVGVTTYAFPENRITCPDLVPLGKPLAQVEAFILNQEGRQVAPGEEGELFIAGPLLARGYLHKEQLTAEKFVLLSIDGIQKRMYRTGDLVRYNNDGDILFLGRIDDQVKIRGYRIEVKEIESVILLTGMVQQCLVMARKHTNGAPYLAGYIIPCPHFSTALFLPLLKKKLPGYMIPAKWVELTEWPLTINNKINRLALPDPGTSGMATVQATSMPLQNDTQRQLHQLWQQFLKVDEISLQDDFFSLGGDSLQLLQLSYAIAAAFGVSLSFAGLFNQATIEKIAALIQQKREEQPSTTTLTGFDAMEATVVQRNFFIRHTLQPSSFPHASITFKITGPIDQEKLEAACRAVIRLHESLHTGFTFRKGKVFKQFQHGLSFHLEHIQCNSDDIDREITAITRPFHFPRPPLFRAVLFTLPGGTSYFHLDMPHINSDGESMKIIMDDLQALYQGAPALPEHRSFTWFQEKNFLYQQSPKYLQDALFWKGQLMDGWPEIHFNGGNGPITHQSVEGVSIVVTVPQELAGKTTVYLRQRGITRFQLLLSTYILLVHKLTKAPAVPVLLPVHNRNEPGMESIVGLLTNIVLVAASIENNMTLQQFLTQCQEKIRSAIAHQAYPFEKVVKEWTAMGRNVDQLYRTFFGYHVYNGDYTFGPANFKLHVHERDKENLPLSAAVFDTGKELIIRFSSTRGTYTKDVLNNQVQQYCTLLHRVMAASGTEPLQVLLQQ